MGPRKKYTAGDAGHGLCGSRVESLMGHLGHGSQIMTHVVISDYEYHAPESAGAV